MNHKRKRFWRVIPIGAIAGAIVLTSSAQPPTRVTPDRTLLGRNKSSTDDVRLIMDGAPGLRVSTLVDRAVRDRDGQELGKVKDTYIDAHSGKTVYVAITSSADKTLRVVPFAGLGEQTSGGILTINLSGQEWQKIAPANVPTADATRVTISPADGRQLAHLFRQPLQDAVSGAQLIALSKLRGKPVSTGTDDVGTIDDVIIDDRGAAAVVITPAKDFLIAARKFVVPAHRLNLGASDLSSIRTDLTRANLEKVPLGTNIPPR